MYILQRRMSNIKIIGQRVMKDVNNFFYRIVTILEDETAQTESYSSILPAVYIIPLDRRGAQG